MVEWIYREMKLFTVLFGLLYKCIVLFIGEFNYVYRNVYTLEVSNWRKIYEL